MSKELKPCPFCGGEASYSPGKTGTGQLRRYIECDTCAAMTEFCLTDEAAAIPWNTRIESIFQAENKKLVDILRSEVDVGRSDVDEIGFEKWLEQKLKETGEAKG